MNETYLFYSWIVSLVLAAILGRTKGRGDAGVLLAFFLGPLGFAILICLGNAKKEAAAAKLKALHEEEVQLLRQALALLQQRAGAPATVRIARRDTELEPMPLAKVQLLIRSGHIDPSDRYFDERLQTWVTLDSLPGLDWSVMGKMTL
jgi:hypothetical protein